MVRAFFHGQRGEVRQRCREGKEGQLGALELVLNAIVLWNTRYLDAAVNHLRGQGMEVKLEDLARLSPLLHGHINVPGHTIRSNSQTRSPRDGCGRSAIRLQKSRGAGPGPR